MLESIGPGQDGVYPYDLVNGLVDEDRWSTWLWAGYKSTWLEQFAATVKIHIECVQEAAHLLGIDPAQAAEHDLSKYDDEEFPFYARNFYRDPDIDTADPLGWSRAWLHHIHYNPHHWQHWIFPDQFTPREPTDAVVQGVVEMPEIYVWEMVADWMGASAAYSAARSMNMRPWLSRNIPSIILHPRSAELTTHILCDLGYCDLFETLSFKVPS